MISPILLICEIMYMIYSIDILSMSKCHRHFETRESLQEIECRNILKCNIHTNCDVSGRNLEYILQPSNGSNI